MASRFEFRLQPLLDRRKAVERQKEFAFAAQRRALNECAAELARLGAAHCEVFQALAECAQRRGGAQLRFLDERLRRLDEAIAEELERLGGFEATCERVRNELVAARRERRVIERLRERRLEVYEAALARREELELGEANARARESARKRQALAAPERAAR